MNETVIEAGATAGFSGVTAPVDAERAASEGPAIRRARLTVAVLEGVVHRILDDADAAAALGEMAELLAQLGDHRSALSMAREALRRHPKAPHLARVYRKMAVRAGRIVDQLQALEAEARLSTHPAYRAPLDLERGRLLEQQAQMAAAQAAYEAALPGHRVEVAALVALERLAGQRDAPARAAELAQRLAEAASDPELRAEHRARAARWHLRAGDEAAARTQAALAAHAGGSPAARAVGFELAADGATAEMLELRAAELADGSLDECAGWFDVGVLAWYRAGDARRAIEAFSAAADKGTGPSRAAALAELAPILARRCEWPRLLEVERARLELDSSPDRKVVTWTRIATLLEERLANDVEAAHAYEQALAEDPGYLPALEGAGRIFQKVASRDRLVRMHELEARSAASAPERAHAFRRLGELLLEEPERREEGVAALRAALAEAPGDPLIVEALQRALAQAGAWAELLALHDTELAGATEPARRGWLLSEIGTIAADRLGDRDRAIAAFREAAAIGAVGPHYVLSRLAQLLEQAGDLAGVADTLEQLAGGATEPVHQASLFERVARTHEQRGDTDAALRAYVRALEIAPPHHSVQAAAGRAFFRAGRFVELAALFSGLAAATAGAERARYLYKAADVAARHLDREAAVASLEAALDLTPDFLPARAALLAILVEQGRWRDAQERLESEPEDELLLVRRAVLAEAGGDRELAIELYGRAVAAGVSAAAGAYERLLAQAKRWRELADHYRSGKSALIARHAHFRAAQLLVDHLGDPAGAAAALEAALAVTPGDAVLLRALRPLVADRPERTRAALMSLASGVAGAADPATRFAYHLDLAAALDEAKLTDEALAVRQRQAQEQRDPVVDLAVELALEGRGADEALLAHLRRVAEDATAEPSVLAWADVAAAARLLDLGRPRDAADACDAAAERGLRSLSLWLTSYRAARALGDATRRRQALSALAEALPAGEERAAALVRLASDLEADGDDGAIMAYRAALRAHPLDATALLALDRLQSRRGEPAATIEPLTRAFEAEDDAGRRTVLGLALVARLLDAGKLSAASDALDRIASVATGDLRVLVAAAELHDRREAWEDLARTYQLIVDHPDTSSGLWFQALWRLIAVRSVRLADKAGAREAASMLRGVDHDDPASWALRLRVLELIDDAPAMAETLQALAKRDDLSDEERARFTLRLAELQESELNDPGAAIDTLSSIQSTASRQEVAQRLLELGEKTGRWASAASALETALDRGDERDAIWEVAIRTRLATLLEGPLGRPESAVRQYERIVELDPGNLGALQRLTTLCGRTNPAAAVDHHRALLARTPEWMPSYHELRSLLLAVEDEDGAFCAEAVLVGLGEATEEESYFYRQRRARLPAEARTTLTADDHAILFPGSDAPEIALLRLIEPCLHGVFPVDHDSYGLAPDASAGADHPLTLAAAVAARVLGVDPPRVALVSPRLGPTIELGQPPLLLLPRTLEDAGRREALYACGELLGRAAVGGILGHPRRQGPGGAQIVDYVIWAVCSAVEPAFTIPTPETAVFRDIRRRVEAACLKVDAARLRKTVDAVLTSPTPLRGEDLLAVFNRAGARAGIVAAGDPAVAIAALKASGSDGLVVDRPGDGYADVAFAVSAGFLALRRRLGQEVRS